MDRNQFPILIGLLFISSSSPSISVKSNIAVACQLNSILYYQPSDFLRLIEFRAPTNHLASLRAHIVLTAFHNVAFLRARVIHYLDHWLFPYHVASLGACPVKKLQIIVGSDDGATL
jgi:hypothetical protein